LKAVFESANRHLGLYFSDGVMKQLYELLQDIIERSSTLQGQEKQVYSSWTGSLDYVESLLSNVDNIYSRQDFKERYMLILS
jgi:hypothetical protein